MLQHRYEISYTQNGMYAIDIFKPYFTEVKGMYRKKLLESFSDVTHDDLPDWMQEKIAILDIAYDPERMIRITNVGVVDRSFHSPADKNYIIFPKY